MIPISEFQHRSFHGPVMREQQFDLTYSQKVRQIVAKYGIKYNPEELIPDGAVADRVFQAGVELLVEVGLYNRDTYRIIQFSQAEIEQIAKETREGPRVETFGKGHERFFVPMRTSEDPRPPVLFASQGSPSPPEMHIPYVQAGIQEELAKGMMGSGITSYGGVDPKANTPGEIICSLAEIKERLEAARRAGKPNCFIGLASAITPGGVMAGYLAGHQDRFNSMISIHLMPELKLSWSRLTLAATAEEWGIVPWTSALSILGALSRGPEDSAVTMIANLLGQLGYGHGTIGIVAAVRVDGIKSSRDVMWAYGAANQACERHIGLPIGNSCQSEAGAGTEMALYEKAALTVVETGSGAAWFYGQGCRNGRGNLGSTGLESRIVGETSQAVAGMKVAQANELAKSILAKYESQIGKAPQGQTFPELYNLKTIKPIPEYQAVYDRVKEELTRLGVPFK